MFVLFTYTVMSVINIYCTYTWITGCLLCKYVCSCLCTNILYINIMFEAVYSLHFCFFTYLPYRYATAVLSCMLYIQYMFAAIYLLYIHIFKCFLYSVLTVLYVFSVYLLYTFVCWCLCSVQICVLLTVFCMHICTYSIWFSPCPERLPRHRWHKDWTEGPIPASSFESLTSRIGALWTQLHAEAISRYSPTLLQYQDSFSGKFKLIFQYSIYIIKTFPTVIG